MLVVVLVLQVVVLVVLGVVLFRLNAAQKPAEGSQQELIQYMEALGGLVVERTPQPNSNFASEWATWVRASADDADWLSRAGAALGVLADANLSRDQLEELTSTERFVRVATGTAVSKDPELLSDVIRYVATVRNVTARISPSLRPILADALDEIDKYNKVIQGHVLDLRAQVPREKLQEVEDALPGKTHKERMAIARKIAEVRESFGDLPEDLARQLDAALEQLADAEERERKKYGTAVLDDAKQALDCLEESGIMDNIRGTGPGPDKLAKWLGGIDHAVLHPSVAAFWHHAHTEVYGKLSNDQKLEFTRLVHDAEAREY